MSRVQEGRVDPWRHLDLQAVTNRPELAERALGIVGGVERGVQVERQVRRLCAQVGLGVARPSVVVILAVDRFDAGRDVLAASGRRSRARNSLTRGRQIDGRLVGRHLLPVVGHHLVRMAVLPAVVALRELLVQAAAVEQDELAELGRGGGDVNGAAEAALDHGQEARSDRGGRG